MNLSKPYPWAGLIIFIIVLLGFWPTYYGPILAGGYEASLMIHFHNVVFMGWVLLLVTQTSLVASQRTDLHKKLGKFGIFLGVLVIVLGVATTLAKVSKGIADGHALEAQQFMLIPLTNMLLFSGFFSAAVIKRGKPQTHKCLITLATVSMLDAPISRMAFLGEPQNPGLLMLVWFLPIFFLLAADYIQKRKVTWLYVTGLVILLASGLRMPLSQTDAWLSIARIITGSP